MHQRWQKWTVLTIMLFLFGASSLGAPCELACEFQSHKSPCHSPAHSHCTHMSANPANGDAANPTYNGTCTHAYDWSFQKHRLANLNAAAFQKAGNIASVHQEIHHASAYANGSPPLHAPANSLFLILRV